MLGALMTNKEHIINAKHLIDDADAILITAGAGMGVDSGLPDFRGNEGFWKVYPPIKELGLEFQEMANPKWFSINPSLAWAFYGHRLNLYRETVPHDGFTMLLELVQNKNDDYFIYTSNVDGQFQKAGFSQEKIVEIHGSIQHFQCSENCTDNIWSADEETINVDMDRFKALDIPVCKYCGETARPNILMFWDAKWNGNRTTEQENRFDTWLKSIIQNNKKLAIIEIGAGKAIPTIRQEGDHMAKQFKNTKLIRINPRDFHMDEHSGFSIPFGALEGLEKILKK